MHFNTEYDWLFCNVGNLGCVTCKQVYDANMRLYGGSANAKVSIEWATGIVGCNGTSKDAQQRSLRKKIHEHKQSINHNAAVALLHKREQSALQNSVAMQSAELYAETCKVFRTAYYTAKHDKPYTDHPDLVELQQLNGVNLGRVLHSNVTCTDIIDHIATQMRQSLVHYILQTKPHVSVVIDKSTNLNRASCLIIYLRATINNLIGPVTFFLDIVELESTTADGIVHALLQCLNETHKLSDVFLTECWIGLGVDGASVMLGNKAGVAAKLKEKFPKLMSWHCFNHRQELSVHDAVKACTEVNHFKSFMDTLYSTYSMSPKCQRELNNCAEELDTQITRIGKVLDVRWVASSCRTVKAVWNSYTALAKHFDDKSKDFSLDGKERSKYSGMLKKLQNPIFIKNLGLMYDALEELADLSLALQKCDITVIAANRLISRQIEVFNARKDTDSTYYREACAGVTGGNFKDVAVSNTAGKEKEIRKNQFYQSLADSMTARLLPQSEKALCEATAIIDPSTWPNDLPVEYGENEMRMLCLKFSVSYSETKIAFRAYKDSHGVDKCPDMLNIINRVHTLPVSTAECERGFSKMNIVCSSLQSRLTVHHLSSLLFISLTGPPVHNFQPLSYVKSWLASNRREATSTNCMTTNNNRHETNTTRLLQSIWEKL